MGEGWIVIPRWDEFQHRDMARSTVPPWVKTYTKLMSDDAFLELSFHQRGVLVSLWLEYATARRQLSDSTVGLSRRLGQRVMRRDLEALSDAGFIEVSASKPAGYHAGKVAGLEVEVEKKVLKRAPPAKPEQQNPAPAFIPNLSMYTGCRYVNNTGAGIHGVYDPLGTDRPQEGWPHPPPTVVEIRRALALQVLEERT